MKRKANRRQRTPACGGQSKRSSLDIGATMHVARWALTAHPTRFAVLGLSLLICRRLIGLRMRVKTVVMGIDQRYWIPILNWLDERGLE